LVICKTSVYDEGSESLYYCFLVRKKEKKGFMMNHPLKSRKFFVGHFEGREKVVEQLSQEGVLIGPEEEILLESVAAFLAKPLVAGDQILVSLDQFGPESWEIFYHQAKDFQAQIILLSQAMSVRDLARHQRGPFPADAYLRCPIDPLHLKEVLMLLGPSMLNKGLEQATGPTSLSESEQEVVIPTPEDRTLIIEEGSHETREEEQFPFIDDEESHEEVHETHAEVESEVRPELKNVSEVSFAPVSENTNEQSLEFSLPPLEMEEELASETSSGSEPTQATDATAFIPRQEIELNIEQEQAEEAPTEEAQELALQEEYQSPLVELPEVSLDLEFGHEATEDSEAVHNEEEFEAISPSRIDLEFPTPAVPEKDVQAEREELLFESREESREKADEAFSASSGQSEDVKILLRDLRQDRLELVSRVESLQTEMADWRRKALNAEELNQDLKAELGAVKKQFSTEQQEFRDKSQQVQVRIDLYVEKIKRLKVDLEQAQNARFEKSQEVSLREKMLEEKIKLIQQDAETQVAHREKLLMDLKRQCDLLEFNNQALVKKEKQVQLEKQRILDKLMQARIKMRGSLQGLEEDPEL
jgi:hypothetical protein